MPPGRNVAFAAVGIAAVAAIVMAMGLGSEVAALGSRAVAAWQSGMDWAAEKVTSAGYLAPVYILLVYTLSSVFCLPLLGFHAVCGYAYGTVRCAALVSVCQTCGAALSFIFVRQAVRPMVEPYLRKRFGARFDAIDKAVGLQGRKIVFLIRASPILPFSMTNYLCGCTCIELWQFVVGTWFGVIPGTTSYCSVGAASKSLGEGGGKNWVQKVLLAFGLCAAAMVCKVMSDIATKTLAEAGVTSEDASESEEKKAQ
eukprot:gnl/TRDRNA2_/TRDRNA2_66848_c0_seq1.p1 gnl/TRDRNA2_/TRDRNA2_66848_c0~~gnl/TRDRNA2_/TRDRNA2_66848_c0_seq1.p1  ORF type:complete len:256 (-),score=28.15 gnl/TRDRNA2_/TRDRNA2_66848_c0_seq1:235-1002(-)